jgi:hypothetical protein
MTAYRCPLSDDDCLSVRRLNGNLGAHAPACYGIPVRYWRDAPTNRAGNLRGMVRRRDAAYAAGIVLEVTL